jgi:hypothetical protein
VRLASTTGNKVALINFLLYQGHLRPGYDYLLERRLSVVRRETSAGPYGSELRRFEAAANALGYRRRTCIGSASEGGSASAHPDRTNAQCARTFTWP